MFPVRSGFKYEAVPKAGVPCPACGRRGFRALCATDRYLMGVTTARCEGCGLVMTNPMPTAAALDSFYAAHYRKYYRKLERPDASYIRRYALDERARRAVEYLARQGLIAPGSRVLDIGCGEGSILRELHRACGEAAGVAGVGVEVYGPFAEFAADYSGCPVYRSLDAMDAAGEDTFDLVIVSHVLEHVPDPVAFLAALRDLLRPGGRVFIDVPDVRAYHWLADLHIAHVYHFAPRTLAAVAGRAGLGLLSLELHRPPKLPACIRAVFHPGPAAVALPDDRGAEDAAAERISRMHRGARLFSVGFRFVMFWYEAWWSVRSVLPQRRENFAATPASEKPVSTAV